MNFYIISKNIFCINISLFWHKRKYFKSSYFFLFRRRLSSPEPEQDASWNEEKISEVSRLPPPTQPYITRIPALIPEQKQNKEDINLNYVSTIEYKICISRLFAWGICWTYNYKFSRVRNSHHRYHSSTTCDLRIKNIRAIDHFLTKWSTCDILQSFVLKTISTGNV